MATEAVRIDKWLWAVRLYKTRSLAAEACQKGHISIAGVNVKPSRDVKIGDVIYVKKTPVTYHYKVLALTGNRLGAKLVPEYLLDVTPEENLKVLEMQKFMQWSERDRGAGRPTKKERREIDGFLDV
jgi:ribosome-associated heat shock protein Hsp15